MDSIHEIISYLHGKGDWQAALETQNRSENEFNKVLWIRPTIDDLEFISNAVTSRGLKSLISIGCGNGFLEWLIQSATGLQVTGIEADRNWWTSPYTTVYIPLVYQEDDICKEILISINTAIMFCYFNNETAFKTYLSRFRGNCLIIIGPKCNRHTNPHPFHPVFERDEWVLKEYKQIQNTDDYIVVYDRRVITD